MRTSRKKQRTGALSHHQLQAFAGASSDEGSDPVAEATDLKERSQQHALAGHFSEARALISQAVRLLPGAADLHELHAQVLLELGCSWEAVRAATRAVELRPDWAEGLVTLARAQLNLGEPTLAEASFERAIELQVENSESVSSELQEARSLAAKQRAFGSGVRAHVVDIKPSEA